MSAKGKICKVDGVKAEHDHHTIPQCYGGVDSPLAPVCYKCHESLHTLGTRLINSKMPSSTKDIELFRFALKKRNNDLRVKFTDTTYPRLVSLSIYIFRAYWATKETNRKVVLSVKGIPVNSIKKLDNYGRRLGLKNRSDIINHIISKL